MRNEFLCGLLFLMSLNLSAQQQLVGAWQMVSIKGVGAEGNVISIDTTAAREIKIITPTHYMLMAHNVEGDSLIFNRTYLGEVETDDDVYIETPMYSSLPIFDNVKTNLRWKVEGDRFIQSGTFTRPDGKTVLLNEMVFKRIITQHEYIHNPAIGMWRLISATYQNFDGGNESFNKNTGETIYMVTPSHWMKFSSVNKKFDHAAMGTYRMADNKIYPDVVYASASFNQADRVTITEVIKHDQLIASGTLISPDGKAKIWEEIYERVK